MNNISTYPKGIIINIGEYNFSYDFSESILVEGMISDYLGDVDIDDISTYPKIIANSTDVIDGLSIFDITDSSATFRFLQLLFSSNALSLRYFYGFYLN
jgi:hypothetical protein